MSTETDLVARLRAYESHVPSSGHLVNAAAAEIERLRADVLFHLNLGDKREDRIAELGAALREIETSLAGSGHGTAAYRSWEVARAALGKEGG